MFGYFFSGSPYVVLVTTAIFKKSLFDHLILIIFSIHLS